MEEPDPDEEEGKVKKSLEEEIKELEEKLFDDLYINSRMLLTSGLIDIDKEIFDIIHRNGLVYNGRLIVKSNF